MIETPTRHGRHISITLPPGFVGELVGQVFHDAKSVVPERLDFDRLSAARRDDPVADLGVHPSELDSGFTRVQQAAWVHFDSVTCAPGVPGNNVREHEIEYVAHKLKIAGISEVSASGFKEPE